MSGKKGYSPKVYQYYVIKNNKATTEKKVCSRCGRGVFMAEHKNRRACGKCGLTEFY